MYAFFVFFRHECIHVSLYFGALTSELELSNINFATARYDRPCTHSVCRVNSNLVFSRLSLSVWNDLIAINEGKLYCFRPRCGRAPWRRSYLGKTTMMNGSQPHPPTLVAGNIWYGLRFDGAARRNISSLGSLIFCTCQAYSVGR